MPDALPGSPNREEPVKARRLGGRVVLKSVAYDRIADYYEARARPGETPATRYEATWRYLSYVIFHWLPEADPLAFSAFHDFCLSGQNAGGYIELERLEAMARAGAPLALEPAIYCRRAFERILDKSDEDGFRLEVAEDRRARSRAEAHRQERGEIAAVRAGWVRKRFFEYRTEKGVSQAEAVKRLAEDYKSKPDTIRGYLRGTELWDSETEGREPPS